jgi:hypothetical protein
VTVQALQDCFLRGKIKEKSNALVERLDDPITLTQHFLKTQNDIKYSPNKKTVQLTTKRGKRGGIHPALAISTEFPKKRKKPKRLHSIRFDSLHLSQKHRTHFPKIYPHLG